MIPVRLKLHNFMPYRDAALDFSGIHLACITGDNGNGKSAVIDAMTWALWGKARAAGDDDLIHANQTDMEIEYDFTIGGQLYRIIRKRARPKKRTGAGQSVLEFQIQNGDVFRPITGDTIAMTQAKIIETLHMDYDTFINSAYLRQGHADEFTRQAPAKRKEVLASILGLEIYDTLEEKAKDLAKSREADNAQVQNTIAEINADLALKPELNTALEQAQTALDAAAARAKVKDDALNSARRKKELLKRVRQQLEETAAGIESRTRDLARWQEQAARHTERLQAYDEIIARRAALESGYVKYTGVKAAADDYDRKLRQSSQLEKQKSQLEQKIDRDRHALINEHTVLQTRISELEKKAAALPDLKGQLQKQQAAGATTASDGQIEALEQRAREAQAEASRLVADNARLERETAEAAEKLAMLERHKAAHTEAKCPLCEQSLTAEALGLLRHKLTGEMEEKNNRLLSNQVLLTQKQAEYTAAIKEKAALEARVNQEKTRQRSQEEVLRAKIKEIEESAAGLAEQKQAAANIEQRLAAGDFAANELKMLTAVEQEIAALGYDAVKHEAVVRDLKTLQIFERDKARLDEALQQSEAEKSAAARAREAIAGLQENLKRDSVKKEELAAELAHAARVNMEFTQSEAEYRAAEQERARAQESVGSVRARLERLDALETKKKDYESRIAAAAKEEGIYRDLARAFGKNGIQALIIDAALPEIAEEANRLLARLTDSRMSVKFETQRTTKKDVLKETLDITIADELGTRNYEMFSGGEAFRINFAIRIALSRLLARRAGAPLPTLIIDEGFGTQDASGMEKLKEAINSIQEDFDKVLVITHMDDLKDAFPNRIDVVKTGDGSTISVS